VDNSGDALLINGFAGKLRAKDMKQGQFHGTTDPGDVRLGLSGGL
jgi:hypothetical protein